MKQLYTDKEFEKILEQRLDNDFNTDLEKATENEIYRALAHISRDMLSDKRKQFIARTYGENQKQVYYLCMEFLLGRSLKDNLYNLGLSRSAEAVLAGYDVSLAHVYEQEPDAGLGNGGLGRLAACYMDGMATTCLPATGHSILYKYGIFEQEIIDGWQQELADNWLPEGSVWFKSHPESTIDVKFDGTVHEHWDGNHHYVSHDDYTLVKAVPSDMYISGYDSMGVSRLRLWQAKAPGFDMSAFNAGEYTDALFQNANVELISKVLYPNDNHLEGKILRLRQQYFLSAASVGNIVKEHLDQYGTMDNFSDKVAIHINDTHPALAVPELMRLLLDECGYSWEQAFDICTHTFAYTNHTVMSEALEKWQVDIFKRTLPRIYSILEEMDRRARAEFELVFPGDDGKINHMAILNNEQVHMANICCYAAHSINGVSQLHSEIIKETIFNDYYLFEPEKFTNVTNGIAYRRWLLQSNEPLTQLLEETIGDGFKKDAAKLHQFSKYQHDKTVHQQLADAKRIKKESLAKHLADTTGEVIDPHSIFDCQAKRMHEYKRQHLNALNILAQYLYIKNNPTATVVPHTYLFAAKAAPGYYMAKQMIRLIYKISDLIEADPAVRDKMRVVFLVDYDVTTSERLIPASEISQQISLAGTEASGTGNMKFMMNGAITLGTLDGANVEISQSCGKENFMQFGMLAEQVEALKKQGYHPSPYIQSDEVAQQVLRLLEQGWHGEKFDDIVSNLQTSDPYMVMADFRDYRRAQAEIVDIYQDPQRFYSMSIANIAGSGIFSADRAVMEYADRIWNIKPVDCT